MLPKIKASIAAGNPGKTQNGDVGVLHAEKPNHDFKTEDQSEADQSQGDTDVDGRSVKEVDPWVVGRPR